MTSATAEIAVVVAEADVLRARGRPSGSRGRPGRRSRSRAGPRTRGRRRPRRDGWRRPVRVAVNRPSIQTCDRYRVIGVGIDGPAGDVHGLVAGRRSPSRRSRTGWARCRRSASGVRPGWLPSLNSRLVPDGITAQRAVEEVADRRSHQVGLLTAVDVGRQVAAADDVDEGLGEPAPPSRRAGCPAAVGRDGIGVAVGHEHRAGLHGAPLAARDGPEATRQHGGGRHAPVDGRRVEGERRGRRCRRRSGRLRPTRLPSTLPKRNDDGSSPALMAAVMTNERSPGSLGMSLCVGVPGHVGALTGEVRSGDDVAPRRRWTAEQGGVGRRGDVEAVGEHDQRPGAAGRSGTPPWSGSCVRRDPAPSRVPA